MDKLRQQQRNNSKSYEFACVIRMAADKWPEARCRLTNGAINICVQVAIGPSSGLFFAECASP